MNVKIYSTPTCPYCKLAKEFFKSKNVVYSDFDVSADPQLANEMIEKSGQMGVPVIEIDGKIIIGFNRTKLEEALNG